MADNRGRNRIHFVHPEIARMTAVLLGHATALGLESVALSALHPPTVAARASFSYWVRWTSGGAPRRGFLSVGHPWEAQDEGRQITITVERPDGSGPAALNARVRRSDSDQLDAALLEGDEHDVNLFPSIRDAFTATPLAPVSAAELNAAPNLLRNGLAAMHHPGGTPAEPIRVEAYTSLLPSEFRLAGRDISCEGYPIRDLRGVVLASSQASEQFGQGLSGSGWTLDGRPLAIQVAGNSDNQFKDGFGQLVAFILDEFAATSDASAIQIVRVE